VRIEKLTTISFPGFYILLFFACGLFLLPGFAQAQVPMPGEIVINELMWMGMGGVASDEWVEFYNPSSSDLTLETCHLENKTGKIIVQNSVLLDKSIQAGGFFVVSYKTSDESKINYQSAKLLSYLALSNTELEVKLVCLGEIIDTAGSGSAPLAGENGTVKKSMERNVKAGDGKIVDSWHTCLAPSNLDADSLDCATPGLANSGISELKPDSIPEPLPTSTDIRLNEIFPYPANGGKEFIELYNFGNSLVDLTGFSIEDGAGHKLILEPAAPLTAGGFYFFEGILYLNNTGEEKVTLYDKNGKELDSISYLDSKENQSWSRDGSDWKWSTTATPGMANIITAKEPPGENPLDDRSDTGNDPPPPKIKLNEIYPYPASGEKEFVELINDDTLAVDLSGWKIGDAAGHKKSLASTNLINPDGYYYLEDDFYLNNSGDENVYLYDSSDTVIDSVSYSGAKENQSWSRDGADWKWSTTSTPGATNIITAESKPAEDPDDEPVDETIYLGDLYLSEILPNPKDNEEENEYIEIYNSGSEKSSLKDWKLKDSGKTVHNFPDGAEIESDGYFAIYRKDYKFALNNSGGETVSLIDPDGHIVSKVDYEKAKENVSYNFDPLENSWSWSKYLTPGEENTFNQDPKIKMTQDKNIYKDMWANFSIKVRDPEKEKTKITWDFGDGHKSYKSKTRHRYEKKGKYEVALTVFDGSEETVKKLKIDVKDFPKYDLEVVAICPNPKGKDADNEWLMVKNNSDKKVDLENWSIATGAKKLVNHPIRSSIEIKPGETKKLTRKDALFSLPNKKAKLEIRYPNGKSAFKMDYEKDKILEDEIYERIDKKWAWITPTQPQKSKSEPVEIVREDETDYQKLIDENMGMFSSENEPVWTTDRVFSENKNIRTDLVPLKNQRKLYIAYDNETNDQSYSFTPPISHQHWIFNFTTYLNTLLARIKAVQLGIL